MPERGLEAFDATFNRTNIWLKEIMRELGTEDRHRAYLTLRGVLQALRDRLTVEEAAHLASSLPLLVRGIYFEGWEPANKPVKLKKEDFFELIRRHFRDDPLIDPEQMARAVFKVLSEQVDKGEIDKVKLILPKDLRELWPEGRAAQKEASHA